MSENTHPKYNKPFSKNVPDTDVTLKKMKYQLDAMERKLDTLLAQSGPRDFKSKYPSKPRREYDETKRPYKEKHTKRKAAAQSEGKFYHGLQSGRKKGAGKRGSEKKRRSFK